MPQFLAVVHGPTDNRDSAEFEQTAFTGWPGPVRKITVPDAFLAESGVSPRPGSAAAGPQFDGQAGLAAVGYGRLNDRSQLLRVLGLPANAPDSAVLLEAYKKWDENVSRRLMGDFAGVVWDWKSRTVMAFRDPLGVRPLYYQQSPTALVVASDVGLILAVGLSKHVPDGQTIVEHLLWQYASRDRTFWRDIKRLPGGHVLVGRPGAAAVARRYWFPSASLTPFSDAGEADEAVAAAFERSVARRVEDQKTVFAHLSGGLDSSSIVCVAAHLKEVAPASETVVTAISELFPGMPTDEGPFIRAVLDWTGIRSMSWHDESTALADLTEPDPVGPGARTYRTSGSSQDVELAAAAGSKVILSGQGGDQFGSSAEVVDDMISGNFAGFLRETLTSRALKRAQRKLRLRLMLRALAPARLRRAVGVHRFRTRLPAWLQPAWHDAAAAIVRRQYEPGEIEFPDAIRRARWADLNSAALANTIDLDQRGAARVGVEFRYPFLDEDLVSVMLRVPAQFWPGPTFNARLHRRALAAYLPGELVTRRTKAEFSFPFARRLAANATKIRRLLESGEWLSDRFTDRTQSRVVVRRALGGAIPPDDWATWRALWGIATLEAWLRAIHEYTPGHEDLNHGRKQSR
jgi:asparagine synthase (glutamine-hydrolysing)